MSGKKQPLFFIPDASADRNGDATPGQWSGGSGLQSPHWKDVFLLAGLSDARFRLPPQNGSLMSKNADRFSQPTFSSQSLPWPIGRILQKIIPPLSEFMIRRVAVS
jgi:hypothetical protein